MMSYLVTFISNRSSRLNIFKAPVANLGWSDDLILYSTLSLRLCGDNCRPYLLDSTLSSLVLSVILLCPGDRSMWSFRPFTWLLLLSYDLIEIWHEGRCFNRLQVAFPLVHLQKIHLTRAISSGYKLFKSNGPSCEHWLGSTELSKVAIGLDLMYEINNIMITNIFIAILYQRGGNILETKRWGIYRWGTPLMGIWGREGMRPGPRDRWSSHRKT